MYHIVQDEFVIPVSYIEQANSKCNDRQNPLEQLTTSFMIN